MHEDEFVVAAAQHVAERAIGRLDHRRIGRQRRQSVALVGLPVPLLRQLDARLPAPLLLAHHAFDLVRQVAERRGLGWRLLAHALHRRAPRAALQLARGAAQRVGRQLARTPLHQHQADQRAERERGRKQHDEKLRARARHQLDASQQRHQRGERHRQRHAAQHAERPAHLLQARRGRGARRVSRRGVRPRHGFGGGGRRSRRARRTRGRSTGSAF